MRGEEDRGGMRGRKGWRVREVGDFRVEIESLFGSKIPLESHGVFRNRNLDTHDTSCLQGSSERVSLSLSLAPYFKMLTY